jgi:DNA polymerase III subunit delta'
LAKERPAASISWTTLGNSVALSALARALEVGPAHAYLFVGQEGLGKSRAAIEFAAAVNCGGRVKPCRECRSCRDTFGGQHPDVEIVRPGGICDEPEHRDNHAESRDLRICQVRRLERVLSLSPYGGGWRVVVIEQAESLRTEAANAFLKTLEEPPDGTVLILITDSEEDLPETILSRCQRVAFSRTDRDTVGQALKAQGCSNEDADRIAALANGRVGWALRALEDEEMLTRRERYLEEAVKLAHASRPERFAWASRAADRDLRIRQDYADELDVWQTWWRDVLVLVTGSSGGLLNVDKQPLLDEESKLYSALEIVAFLKSLTMVRSYLEQNVDPQLALENLMLDLPQPRGAGAVRSR